MQANRNVMIMAAYMSVYGGNFIASLVALDEVLSKGGKDIIFVFPPLAKHREWCKRLVEKNITVLFLDPKLGRLKQTIELLKVAKKYHCGLIYTHFTQYDVVSALGCWLRPSLKLFWHVHSDFTGVGDSSSQYSLKNRLKAYMRNCIIGRKAALISVSEHLNERFLTLGKPTKLCIYLPNAVAKDRFIEESMNREEARFRMSITCQQVFVLLFGWHPQVKGMDIAVEAMRIARKSNQNLVLGIVVGEQCNEERAIEYINTHTNCSGREEWIVYLQPVEDVFLYHRAADIMLSSSRSEGFSYSILETLSIGNLVVNSDIRGTRWAKEHALTYTFISENAEDCSHALLEAAGQLSNMDHQRIKAQTMEDIAKQYDIRKWCQTVIGIFD